MHQIQLSVMHHINLSVCGCCRLAAAAETLAAVRVGHCKTKASNARHVWGASWGLVVHDLTITLVNMVAAYSGTEPPEFSKGEQAT